jgi:DNA-binding PadR family transcriptional regulator
VVRLADRLQERGLVTRERSERDGRAVALRLTDTGREAADAALAAREDAITRALGALDASERRALTPLLERMLGAETTDSTASLVICRMCDPDVCGHPKRCPVTQAAIARS